MTFQSRYSIHLHSDWTDYYDYQFDSPHTLPQSPYHFFRYSRNSISRIDMMRLFDNLKLKTPNWVIIDRDEQFNITELRKPLVYHSDIYAHCGQGKQLLESTDDLEALKPTEVPSLLVEYIRNSKVRTPTSYRFLQIGNKNSYYLTYTSDHTWKSNQGTCQISQGVPAHILSQIEKRKFLPYFKDKFPLWSIDFVADDYDNVYAIDFNTSPGLQYTGIEHILKPLDINRLIGQWFESTDI